MNRPASILNCHGMPCRSVRTRAYNRSCLRVQRARRVNLCRSMTGIDIAAKKEKAAQWDGSDLLLQLAPHFGASTIII